MNVKVKRIKTPLKDELVKTYSGQMIYMVDFSSYFITNMERVESLNNYFYSIMMVVIVCFLFTIFNQLTLAYLKMKGDISRLKALGATNGVLIGGFFKMGLLIVATVSGVVLSVYLPVVRLVPYLLLFFNTYQMPTGAKSPKVKIFSIQ